MKDKATLGYNIIDRWRYKQLFLAFFELIQLELEFLFSLSLVETIFWKQNKEKA